MRYLLIAAGSACEQPWDREQLSSLLSANELSPDDGETIFICPAPDEIVSDDSSLPKITTEPDTTDPEQTKLYTNISQEQEVTSSSHLEVPPIRTQQQGISALSHPEVPSTPTQMQGAPVHSFPEAPPAPAQSDQALLAKLAENAPTSHAAFSRIPYYRAEPICDTLLPLVREADLVLFAAGPEGDELACRLAVRCGGSAAAAVQHFALSELSDSANPNDSKPSDLPCSATITSESDDHSNAAAPADVNGPEKKLLVRRSTYAGHMTGTWQLTKRPYCISLARTLQTGDTSVSHDEPAQAKNFAASAEPAQTDDPARSSDSILISEPAQAQGSHPGHPQPAASTQPTDQTLPQIREFAIDFNDPLHPEDRTIHTDAKAGASLENTDFLLAVGRGIKSARGAASASEHAQRLGAALGATRPVVMSAWLPMEKLVGVSGSLTSPKVALVCGAGGSPAFYSGIEQARTIIAINTDPAAPIMKKSDLAIVGDWNEVLTVLTLDL